MTMTHAWLDQIDHNLSLSAHGAGPDLFAVVSGSPADAQFWGGHFDRHAADLFPGGLPAPVRSLVESVPKGSLLGTLAAWQALRGDLPRGGLALISLLFGAGKRLSPFTQALGNRKAALRVPRRGAATGEYLTVADLVVMFSTSLVDFLGRAGFAGALVRWGDEVQLPGIPFPEPSALPQPLDGVRLAWFTDPTPQLAREKDWLVVEPGTGLLAATLPRQPRESLLGRLDALGLGDHRLAVNLGSLGVSRRLLDAATEAFSADVADDDRRVDWDPYFWVAFQNDAAGWEVARRAEADLGRDGIEKLEAGFPEFASKAREVREHLGEPAVYVIDYGEPFWFDCGLQPTLRRAFLSLTSDTAEGAATRALLGVPQDADADGNRLAGSDIAAAAEVRNSVVIDSKVGAGSRLDGAVVAASTLGEAHVPTQGAVLFCEVEGRFDVGAEAVAYGVTGADLAVEDRGRATTLAQAPGAPLLRGSEDLAELSGEDYTRPVLGNPMSFAEAARLAAAAKEPG